MSKPVVNDNAARTARTRGAVLRIRPPFFVPYPLPHALLPMHRMGRFLLPKSVRLEASSTTVPLETSPKRRQSRTRDERGSCKRRLRTLVENASIGRNGSRTREKDRSSDDVRAGLARRARAQIVANHELAERIITHGEHTAGDDLRQAVDETDEPGVVLQHEDVQRHIAFR